MGPKHSQIKSTTDWFTGKHPMTDAPTPLYTGSTTPFEPDSHFVIPPGWRDRCQRDKLWCQDFIDQSIKALMVQSLFPGITIASVDKINPEKLKQIKAQCGSNTTCFNAQVTAECNRLTAQVAMQRFKNITSPPDNTPAIALFAIVGVILAIAGGALAFYFIFAPTTPNREDRGGHFSFFGPDSSQQQPQPPQPGVQPSISGSRARSRRGSSRPTSKRKQKRSSSRHVKSKSRKSKRKSKMKGKRSKSRNRK